MSELYMDNIDRALAEEYARYRNGCPFENMLKAGENPWQRQTVPEHIIRIPAPGNVDARPEVEPLIAY
ncbi:MAG: hypothetical protein ABR886_05235 [Dehalococcoidales bacterium]|jgi:hypothetical protein